MISSVNQAYNVIEVTNNYLENVLFYGKGAGRYVTASAVVSDIIKCHKTDLWEHDYHHCDNIYPITKSKYYIRCDHELDIDFDTYFTSSIENEFVVSNCLTGKPEYLSENKDEDRLATIATASCALPLVGKPVKTEDTWYMDGSMTDPIPVQHTLDKGCERIVLISTKGEGMDPSDLSKYNWAMRILYGKKFNPFLKAMKNRLDLYYKQWDMIYDLEKKGTLFLIQPQGDIAISHLETDPVKLRQMYDSGYAYGKSILEDVKKFLELEQ